MPHAYCWLSIKPQAGTGRFGVLAEASRSPVRIARRRLQDSAQLPILARVQTVLGILATVAFAVGLPALWIWARRQRNAPQGQPSRITSAMVRYIGLCPANPTELQRLVWIRQLNLKLSCPWIPVLILFAFYLNATWAYVVLGVMVVAEACGLALLTRDIRRARRAEPAA
jgi:hypothetical protein